MHLQSSPSPPPRTKPRNPVYVMGKNGYDCDTVCRLRVVAVIFVVLGFIVLIIDLCQARPCLGLTLTLALGLVKQTRLCDRH